MIDDDDLADDPLDGDRSRIEQRFRELEREEQLRELRGEHPSPGAAREAAAGDDLAAMKAAFGEQPSDAAQPAARSAPAPADAERFVLLLCPSCATKNRTSLTRVRSNLPRCGACKQPLWFAKG